MYFVHIYDEEIEDCANILCFDIAEVQKTIHLVDENSDRFSFVGVESVNFVNVEELEEEIKKSKI